MNDRSELTKFLWAVLTWWWLIALFVVAAAAASYVYSSRQEKVYEATTTVVVGQSIQVSDPTTQDLDTSRRLAQTYALIIRRQPIMQAVVNALDLDMSWRNLRSMVSVYLVPNTQLIEITVEADNIDDARRIADEIAQQFILYTPTLEGSNQTDETTMFVEDRLERLKEKISSGQADIDRKEREYLNAGLESERQAIEREIARLEGVVSTWESNFSRLIVLIENKEVSNYVAVIEPAQGSSGPVSPDIQMNVLLAAAVGLLLGMAVVFLLEYLDDTFKSEGQLEQETHLIPLGMVNQMKSKEEKLITAQDPFSAAQEAYRMIRSNIQFMAVARPSKTLMITSPGANDGKSLTAANVALTMAQAGLKIILVDADLRQPKQHTLFKLNSLGGLTDLLMNAQIDLERVLKPTALENLQVVTSGTRPPNPTELLSSERMVDVLAELSYRADVVILDSMPVLPVADSVVLSNRVDGVILVIDSTRTRRSDVRSTIQSLEKADAKIWGAILNRVPRKRARYLAGETGSSGPWWTRWFVGLKSLGKRETP